MNATPKPNLSGRLLRGASADPSQKTALSEIEMLAGADAGDINVHHRGDWVRQQPEFLALSTTVEDSAVRRNSVRHK